MMQMFIRVGWLTLLCSLGQWLAPTGVQAKLPKAQQQAFLKQMSQGSVISRCRALSYLGREKVWSARPAIRRLLKRKRLAQKLRICAMLAAGRLGDKQATPLIEQRALRTSSFWVRMSAVWSLVKIGKRSSLKVIIRLTERTRSNRAREFLVWALASYKDRSTAKYLYKMLNYSFHTCSTARRALRNLGLVKSRVSCSRKARNERRRTGKRPS